MADKWFMYEEDIRVAGFIRDPRHPQGRREKAMVLNVDFAPTMLDLAGVPIPPSMQGRSLVPLLEGTTPADWQKSLYYHYYEFPGAHDVHRHYGVKTARYKLMHYYHLGEWELFDLERDPHDLKNVYGDPAYADVRKELEAELARLRQQYQVPDDPKPEPKTKSD